MQAQNAPNAHEEVNICFKRHVSRNWHADADVSEIVEFWFLVGQLEQSNKTWQALSSQAPEDKTPKFKFESASQLKF